ncbi:MAG: ABC transporter ATP-binding protein [Actinobacteria bacterium]|nr:ABC transporter ATP-binding protein [Actinomycetota bacterium]
MDAVRLEGVGVVRSGTVILDDVSLVIAPEDRWVVLGPNGAGKTTLLALMSTQLFPTSGEVMLLDEIMGAVDVFDLRPRIGLASPTSYAQIPPTESVHNAVMTSAWAVAGRWKEEYSPEDEQRAIALMEAMGVRHLAQRTIGTLSEGERKRVLIARALMSDPELLLLDEPAAGLDLGAREDLVSRLGALATSPLSPALVLVTHHVEEIPVGITHALLLREGRVVSAGPIDTALTSESLTQAFGVGVTVAQLPVTGGVRWVAHTAERSTPSW